MYVLTSRSGQDSDCIFISGWALTFPNVGFIATIRVLADIFDLQSFYVWHIIMVVLICITWLVLFFLTMMAFWRGKILMAKPEDVVIDSMSPKEIQEMEKMSMRSETPDEERGRAGFDRIPLTPRPF